MTYRSKVQCDACQREAEAPGDGGFPFGWVELNFKPSQRGPTTAGPKRTRFHLCGECCTDVLCLADIFTAHERVAAARSPLESM